MKPNLPSTELLGSSKIEIHYKRPIYSTMDWIASADDADRILRRYINLKRIDYKEFFWVILLNQANRVLGISEIGVGGTTGVLVDVKEICQLALLTSSIHIIAAHCHPSGRLKASTSDIEITKKIKKALALFEIKLLDHLIITKESYLSLANDGLF